MKMRSAVLLLRPKHWLKNSLVLAALFFSFSFTAAAVSRALLAAAAFCLLASAVYIINDLADAELDRHHPVKKSRPIASGEVPRYHARVMIWMLLLLASGLFWCVGWPVMLVGLVYLGINAAYSFGLKNVPIVDVMIVALGFVLRVYAGAAAIGVAVSHWLLLCTFFLALFVAFGKRKHEMMILNDDKNRHRRSMREYTDGFIDQMLSLTATTAVVFYSLYTIDSETMTRFNGDALIYSTPIVVFGVLRYYYLLYNRGLGGDPVMIFSRDRAMLISTSIWLLSVLLIYLGGR